MIRPTTALPLIALVMAAPLAAPAWAQAARDFQLPPAATPTPDTRVQGPVDSDAPVIARPRATQTATPTPTPSATATPTITSPAATPARAPIPQRQPAAPSATAVPSAATVPSPGVLTQTPQPGPVTAETGAAPIEPLPLPSTTGSAAAPPGPAIEPGAAPGEPAPAWPWIALGGLALVVAGAFAAWRRRGANKPVPNIIAPVVPAAAAPGESLAISVEAVRLDRSVLNATVGYRVTIRNRTAQALSGIAIEADLVSASRERTAEQQIATPTQALTPRHAVERLAPGQSMRFEGQARLPLSEASAIWQGRAALLVPLLRVRATAASTTPVATTLVIGTRDGSAARPQPFRLDEPPRSYAPLAQRVLDAAPAPA